MRGSNPARLATMALTVLGLGLPIPGQAQPIPQGTAETGGTVRAGTLQCNVAGSIAFVFGSTRQLTCDYLNVTGRRERYTGEIGRFGVDIGFTKAAVMLWAVVAPTADTAPGVLAGSFVGVSGSATVGVGAGANVLVGGSNRSIQLQPLSIEGNVGLNVAAGVVEIRLRAAE